MFSSFLSLYLDSVDVLKKVCHRARKPLCFLPDKVVGARLATRNKGSTKAEARLRARNVPVDAQFLHLPRALFAAFLEAEAAARLLAWVHCRGDHKERNFTENRTD